MTLVMLAIGGAFMAPAAGFTATFDDLEQRTAEVSFTKWLTAFPNMAGTAGGDVMGSYDGIIHNIPDQTKPITEIDASYHFNTGGSGNHSFTARLKVTQDNEKGTAVLSGLVTDGWRKGSRVEGEYRVIRACDQSPAKAPANLCFQGKLRVAR